MSDLQYSKAWRVFGDNGMNVLMHLTLKLDLQGVENAPQSGPLLLIINHNSFLDPLVPCVFVRHDIFPMAKAEALEHPMGWMLKWYGAFPVRRGEADASALKQALRVLHQGHTLLMAPEGTRNPAGVLQEGHEGAALIAVRAGAPILPVAMFGGAPYLKNLKKLRRTPIHMRVGKPVIARATTKKPSRGELREITDEMMYTLAALVPPEMRGRYADVAQKKFSYLMPLNATGPTAAMNQEMMPMTN